MEKIDIVLKAVLELKEEVAVLGYKIDNLESKIDSLEIGGYDQYDDEDDSSSVIDETNEDSSIYEDMVKAIQVSIIKKDGEILTDEDESSSSESDEESNEGDSTSSDDEPDPDKFEPTLVDQEPQNDPFEGQEPGMSSEDLCEAIKNGIGSFQNENKPEKKKEITQSALDSIEELKKKQAALEKMSESIQYDINNHLGIKL